MIIVLGPEGSRENLFEKKASFPIKKVGLFFLYYKVERTSRNNLKLSAWNFDIYCAK